MKPISVLFFITFYSVTLASAEKYVFEFGTNAGRGLYTEDGKISLFQWKTDISIPVAKDDDVLYVKVTVDALAPPTVDYDPVFRRVTINYSLTQITLSNYSILVKGT